MKIYYLILTLFVCSLSIAQSTISGSVKDKKNQPIAGANIRAVGEPSGTSTDFDGSFTIKVSKKSGSILEISSVGFLTKKVTVSSADQMIQVTLSDEETKLDEIVVSASRTPERVIESPVTIERMTQAQIKSTTAPTFYDGLENLKEVHFNTSSLSFKSINTRGFSSVANTRFLQLVDGMDNASPALNFVLGNLIGLSDLDVANVELLPGASSALYGANAFNGILFMNSKSPFTKEGISFYFKYGQTSQQAAGTNDVYDFGIRAAKAFTKHFALKGNFAFMKATEWIAADKRDLVPNVSGGAVNPNYDGLNVYGDEVSTGLRAVGQAVAVQNPAFAPLVNSLPTYNVSRTGYREQDLSDNTIKSIKADFSAHIKPFDNDFEIILQHKVGTGNTIYQGANRYFLKNFIMNQSKVEVKGKNFFARAYMTTENAGDSYDMRFAAWNVNRAWKADNIWFGQYAAAFAQSANGLIPGVGVLTTEQAHAYARTVADQGRFLPGSPQFNAALLKVVADPNLTTGAKFQDQSRIYHTEGNYNFKDLFKAAEIQVGGSLRQYEMNSKGSIFTDYDGPIRYNEYGIYTQVQKKFMDDRLKFTGSARYDKAANFKGFVSPRLSFTYAAGESKRHNFRVSYQTGFRNPTTQDQYIGLDLGPFALIGSAPDNLVRFQEVRTNSTAGSNAFNPVTNPTGAGAGATATLNGVNAYNNSYTLASVSAFGAALAAGAPLPNAAALLKVADIGLVKPEQVKAFEVGYRSIIQNDLSVDINGYYNIYNDFLNQSRVITPNYGNVNEVPNYSNPATLRSQFALINGDRRVYQVYNNSKTEITSMGFGVGLSKKVYKNFEAGVNYNYAEYKFDQEKDPSFIPGFNTPKHRIKGSFGNPKLFKNFGFNANVRWSTAYLWQSSFGDGIVPEVTVFDAQINYVVRSIGSVFKVGATNIGGKDYIQVIGAGAIGQQWFASWTINP